MILPEVRDLRMVTIRRGGTLRDEHHQLLARWAAECAEHVLALFETVQPGDARPRDAIVAARAWADGEMSMMQARTLGGHAMGAARPLRGAARFAAYAAGQAACVGHVAEHDLGAAAYALKAVRSASGVTCDDAANLQFASTLQESAGGEVARSVRRSGLHGEGLPKRAIQRAKDVFLSSVFRCCLDGPDARIPELWRRFVTVGATPSIVPRVDVPDGLSGILDEAVVGDTL